MKKRILVIIILFSSILIGSIFVNAQKISNKNTIVVSDEENLYDLIGSSPPPGPVRMPAEFEPMEGVLIAYPFGISYQIIAEMSEDVEVVTIVASESQKNQVISLYQSHGVNLDNCDFLIAPSDTKWTRDYGPWFIFNGDDEQGIVDHVYNRPRPNDDLIPTKFGEWRNIPVYNLPITHTGGNYMTDGQGIAVSTDLVWSENPSLSHVQIDQLMLDYCGIETYHVVPDVLGEYIKHIDCWAKYLTPDTIMIIETSPLHSHYYEIEEAVDFFESQISCYGTPYNVERVYTHLEEPYINCLILNDKVLVPITGSQWDDEAIESFETALPGYEVLGFTGSWYNTDALHCRTKGIVDRYMLYIKHTPIYGIQEGHDGYEIISEIIPYSQENLKTSSTGVYWKIEGGSWNFIEMEAIKDNEYLAIIPQQETGTIVYYYIHAEDDSERSENHPYIGESMAYSFECNFTNEPPLKPAIHGPIQGNIDQNLEFTFESTDPEEDDIYYYINWGDGNSEEWIGPYKSGEVVLQKHIWTNEGNFTIEAKTKDAFDYESNWETLNINIPRYKNFFNSIINRFSVHFHILKYFLFFLY